MTSLAFILGVMPLALSTGAGAGARRSVGTGVMGGMLAATFLAIFFVPLFFRLMTDRKLFEKRTTAQLREEIEHHHRVMTASTSMPHKAIVPKHDDATPG
jgi:HAE1 family hydrophobic/amphiphilic exporter-1/multidrug efflux pump